MTDDDIRAQAQAVRGQYPRAAAAIVELLRQRDEAKEMLRRETSTLEKMAEEHVDAMATLEMKVAGATAPVDALRAKLADVTRVGSLLANAAFNLSQNEELAAEVTDLLRNLSREWDRAFARAAVAIEAKP
jgi:ubiquinone biosynthesis protein UbiJ